MAMVDIALNSEGNPISLQDISARQHIALNYLEQIFALLRKEGLVTSLRGPGGGYLLNGSPDAIKVGDIITAVDESMKITRCSDAELTGCMHDKTRCLTHDLWEGLGNHIRHYLDSVSLADICHRKTPKQGYYAA